MKDRDVAEEWIYTPDGKALFMSSIRREGGCLVWTRETRENDWPTWRVGGRYFSARRIMWKLQGDTIPARTDLMNTCGNPRCLTHLVADVNSSAAQTHCVNGHPYEEGNLVQYVTRERRCLVCHRAQSREAVRRYRARKRAEIAAVREGSR
ncbi:hypothetical protein [Streptomyces sp. IBSNAI001]|uniref:hypothetical protein n=1 Tax=Streptomyces sp. IBSNAI001 TaxID=3457499 RepID=UPI003FD58DCF